MMRGLEGLTGVIAVRDWPNEAGQPAGRVKVAFGPGAALNRDQVVERLRAGEPRIEVLPSGADAILLNPVTLQPGEEQVAVSRMRAVLRGE